MIKMEQILLLLDVTLHCHLLTLGCFSSTALGQKSKKPLLPTCTSILT
uniref:Uncharacterized protein n=1 Tax=Arundo donax TaxID=35708 RepID=A0A0A9AMR6_ARUDO